MKKWKRILSAILAVLLLSGSMPVWAAETVDPDEQAGDIQELKEKLGVSHTQKEENKPMRGLKI